MSATAFEVVDSPSQITLSGNEESERHEYCVIDTEDRDEAYEAILAIAPTSIAAINSTLERTPPKLTYKGGGVWVGEIVYKPTDYQSSEDQEPPQPNEWELDFDTTGETQKIYAGISQQRYQWSEDDPAPDLKNAVGMDGTRINGVDVPIPGLKLRLSVAYDPNRITANTVKMWSRYTGTVNSNQFISFAPGELLYLGATGKITLLMNRGIVTKPVPVVHHFIASENINQNFNVGSEIVVNGKRGHDRIDVVIDDVDTGDVPPRKVRKIRHVYVTKIFKEGNLSQITGIRQ